MSERLDLADLAAIAAELLEIEPHDLLGVFDVDVALDVLASVWDDNAGGDIVREAARLLTELATRAVLPSGHLRLAVVAVVMYVERNGSTVSLEPVDEVRKFVHAISCRQVDVAAVETWISSRIRRVPGHEGRSESGENQPPPTVDDLVALYLAEVERQPPLTAEEELAHAQAVARARDLGADAEDRDAVEQAADESRRRLVQANLGLVVALARRYDASGLPLLDLIKHGNFGLMTAVERYDWTKGFKFSTYATWWIRQAITRGIADARGGSASKRQPATDVFLSSQELEVLTRLAAGREPSEIANDLFISRKTVFNHIRNAVSRLQNILETEADE